MHFACTAPPPFNHALRFTSYAAGWEVTTAAHSGTRCCTFLTHLPPPQLRHTAPFGHYLSLSICCGLSTRMPRTMNCRTLPFYVVPAYVLRYLPFAGYGTLQVSTHACSSPPPPRFVPHTFTLVARLYGACGSTGDLEGRLRGEPPSWFLHLRLPPACTAVTQDTGYRLLPARRYTVGALLTHVPPHTALCTHQALCMP